MLHFHIFTLDFIKFSCEVGYTFKIDVHPLYLALISIYDQIQHLKFVVRIFDVFFKHIYVNYLLVRRLNWLSSWLKINLSIFGLVYGRFFFQHFL